MEKTENLQKTARPENRPDWYTGKTINEPAFCRDFLATHRLAYVGSAWFSPEGRLEDENLLRAEVYRLIEPYLVTSVGRKTEELMKGLRIKAQAEDFQPQTDRIHLLNGTLFLDGRFSPGKDGIVRSRFPVRYNPNARPAERWQRFLSELLWPEDIPTLQEFIGYCLIPSNAGQKMLVIKGSGGEGKSQIGHVLSRMFGVNAKDGSVGKISENAFARADLEHIHLMIDDDMRLEALKQTNYVKSIVTAQGKMDLERKGRQSYQGWMYARILAFSNGDLISLYDRSDGFFRRQLILTARPKPEGRPDDPELAEKLCAELEGILLWAFEGLKRLARNRFRFTESERARRSREAVRQDANNAELFLGSKGYIARGDGLSISNKELYATWCDENAYLPMKRRSFVELLAARQDKFGIRYTTHLVNAAGREVRGFKGLAPAREGIIPPGWMRACPQDNPFQEG